MELDFWAGFLSKIRIYAGTNTMKFLYINLMWSGTAIIK
jgi:hypothetical protein